MAEGDAVPPPADSVPADAAADVAPAAATPAPTDSSLPADSADFFSAAQAEVNAAAEAAASDAPATGTPAKDEKADDPFDPANAAFDSVSTSSESESSAIPQIDDAALQELLKLAEMEAAAAPSTAKAAQGAAAASSDADGDFMSAAGIEAAGFDLPNFQQVIADAAASSIDLLRDVELNVKIELGRSRMVVEDVLKLAEGSVVELDKLAGDPVDVFVNDRLVARGEVLVLNDNFCVRVNEIVTTNREDAAA
ncbi:MAG TPA: flagellar motor switch protein FliN [Tepidisphaeraceae bacterium]|nr:flagellar motor switch protein FliN [Tepidisphaeraceae bacterium]